MAGYISSDFPKKFSEGAYNHPIHPYQVVFRVLYWFRSYECFNIIFLLIFQKTNMINFLEQIYYQATQFTFVPSIKYLKTVTSSIFNALKVSDWLCSEVSQYCILAGTDCSEEGCFSQYVLPVCPHLGAQRRTYTCYSIYNYIINSNYPYVV